MADPDLLRVRGLTVSYPGMAEPALANLDLTVSAGECVALVGPSGCGKSTLCRALLDLLPMGSSRTGDVVWRGRSLTDDPVRWRSLRGAGIGLVLQDHRHALDPVRRVGCQIEEIVALHRPDLAGIGRDEEVRRLFREVQYPDTEAFAARYPHQLSGGQRQRVGLAAALAAKPSLLLADEPTTALDLIVQREIIALLQDLVACRHLGLILVTHDRDVVPLLADRVVDLGRDRAVTVDSRRRLVDTPRSGTASRLTVRDLTVAVDGGGGRQDVVHRVSLDLVAGRTLGLAGPSGSGKTTLARALAGWCAAREGRVEFRDWSMDAGPPRRGAVQLVSQDAAAALDPQQTVWSAVFEAASSVAATRSDAHVTARRLLAEVGLDEADRARRPGRLSGGQRQRAQLARALAVRPRVLLADEPTSSLDAGAREQLLSLLTEVQHRHGLAVLLISHDLALLENWCHEIAVLLEGHLVEQYRPGDGRMPLHPFARDLAAAAPARLTRASLRPEVGLMAGVSGQPTDGAGCPYAADCGLVQAACRAELPPLADLGRGHLLRCPETASDAR